MNDPEMNRIRQTQTTSAMQEKKDVSKESVLHKGVVYFQSGETIFNDGDEGDEAYIVVKGKVELSKLVCGEKEALDTISANSVFGEMALFNGGKRVVTAIALEETECAVVNMETFQQQLDASPVFIRALIRIMAKSAKKYLDQKNDYCEIK